MPQCGYRLAMSTTSRIDDVAPGDVVTLDRGAGERGTAIAKAGGHVRRMLDLLGGADRAASKRAFEAMMTMAKIDIAAIEAAAAKPA